MSAEAQKAISAWLGERDESAARELMAGYGTMPVIRADTAM